MSDDDKTPANGASNTSKDNAVEEMTAEDVVETVSDAILSLSSNAKDLAAKMDSESRDVAAAAEEIVENMKDAADGEPLKSDETASGDGAAEPTKKHHHSRTASGPLLAAAAAVATAAETAAKSVETAAKDLAGRINLEPVLTTINEAAGKASEAAKDLVAKVDLEQVKQTAEQAAERAMDAAGRAATAMDGAQRNLAKKLNIEPMEFAPLNVPMERRRQTFAVLLWALIAPISWFLIFYCVFLTSSWLIRTLFLAYCAWIYVDDAPIRGARPSALFRHNPLWRWFVDYYPASLIKTADLDPSKNYLFGYHPHGILGFGAWATFATNGTGFEEAFPGVTPHLCTLNINFKTPFAREWLMAHGVISADKKSILNVWKKGKGESVAIVIGGAEEGYYAKPGTADLVLNKRLGFVKLALSQGVAIVPCFAFGENELFNVITNPTLDKISKFFKDTFGFTTPLVHGRGVFTYNWGILPRRHPIHIVVGKPIELPKVAEPSEDMIKEYHAKYQAGLKEIYDEWKERLSPRRRQSLRFIK